LPRDPYVGNENVFRNLSLSRLGSTEVKDRIQSSAHVKAATKRRVWLVVGVILFVLILRWAYINWLSLIFGYYGFTYTVPPDRYLALAFICSVLPSLWMPMEVTRPSQLGYWVLYLTVFIPSMVIPLFVQLSELPSIARLIATLFVGFAILGSSYLFPLRQPRPTRQGQSVFWYGFALLIIICGGTAFLTLRNNIHLVSFSEIYDVRDAASEMSTGPLTNYSVMWLYGAINPFLIAWGLFYKRPSFFIAGALGQLLVYSSFGTKASLLSVVFILGLYLLFRIGKAPFALKLTWVIVAFFALLCGAYIFSGEEPGLILFGLLFLVFFRSFGLAGLLTGQYLNFFQHNPFTHYSHLKIVDLFVRYPFHYPLGTEIGYYYYNPLVDTTAHFWATDGIAALGLPGILLISIIGAVVFWCIDSFTQHQDPRLAGLATFYATYSLANLSMFTTFLSGGLGLLILLLYFAPLQPRSAFKVRLKPVPSPAPSPRPTS
jgi:hypothetical protein